MKLSSNANSIKELYDARHTAYFKAWDNNKYLKDQSHIVMHDSGGIYLTNIDTYFESFDDFFIYLNYFDQLWPSAISTYKYEYFDLHPGEGTQTF